MQHIKKNKYLLCVALLLIGVLLISTLVLKRSTYEYFIREPEIFKEVAFELIYEYPTLEKAIVIDRTANMDEIVVDVNYSIPTDIAEDILLIFKKTNCDAIVLSLSALGNPYCSFETFGFEAVNGIAYVGKNSDPKTFDPIFSYYVTECVFLEAGWIRFEHLTAEGEKRIPG